MRPTVYPPTIKYSPWGPVQDQWHYGDGIDLVSTAGHGGFKLDRQRNALVPKVFRKEGGWYEEDCDYAIVIHFYPDSFSEKEREMAERSLKYWHWREWEQHTGTTLAPGESGQKDDYLWKSENAGNWVCRAAWGDWHDKVPPGMVGVFCKKETTGEEAYFLVPKGEYDAGRFVADESKHQRVEKWV